MYLCACMCAPKPFPSHANIEYVSVTCIIFNCESFPQQLCSPIALHPAVSATFHYQSYPHSRLFAICMSKQFLKPSIDVFVWLVGGEEINASGDNNSILTVDIDYDSKW